MMDDATHNDLARLRQWIQNYIDEPDVHETWTDLFTRAGVSIGTMANIRSGNFKSRPSMDTVEKLAVAMGRTAQEAWIAVGYLQANAVSDAILRSQKAYDLPPLESRLIDSFRKIGKRDEHSQESYQQVAYEAVRGMAEAGGMQ